MERREAPAFFQQRTRQDGRLVRRLALHPLGVSRGEGMKDGVPAPQKNRGGGALAD